MLSIGAWGSRDPVSAKLEWELVLRPSGRSPISSRVCAPILVIQVLLWRRLCSLLLARLLSLCWRQLLLCLPLPSAVWDVVHLPFMPLGRWAIAAVHRSLVILLLLLIHGSLLAREGAARGRALSGELIAIGIMSLLLLLLLRVAAGRVHPRF